VDTTEKFFSHLETDNSYCKSSLCCM